MHQGGLAFIFPIDQLAVAVLEATGNVGAAQLMADSRVEKDDVGKTSVMRKGALNFRPPVQEKLGCMTGAIFC